MDPIRSKAFSYQFQSTSSKSEVLEFQLDHLILRLVGFYFLEKIGSISRFLYIDRHTELSSRALFAGYFRLETPVVH